jgi:hypothetical protein
MAYICAAFSCSGPRHGKLPTAEPRPKTPTPDAEAVSQRRQLLRLGAAGLLGRALFGAVFALQGLTPRTSVFSQLLCGPIRGRRAHPMPEARPRSRSATMGMSVSRARTPTDVRTMIKGRQALNNVVVDRQPMPRSAEDESLTPQIFPE